MDRPRGDGRRYDALRINGFPPADAGRTARRDTGHDPSLQPQLREGADRKAVEFERQLLRRDGRGVRHADIPRVDQKRKIHWGSVRTGARVVDEVEPCADPVVEPEGVIGGVMRRQARGMGSDPNINCIRNVSGSGAF